MNQIAHISYEDRAKAAMLWKRGDTLKAIGEELGIPWRRVVRLANKNRKMFPYRKSDRRRDDPVIKMEVVSQPTPILAAGRVVRTTISGSKVTMPRVAFIDGPECEARAV